MTEADFECRTALVTGGSRGIGRAICVRLAKAGARVAINHSASPGDANETLRQVQAEGATGLIVQADVSDYASTDAMFDAVEAGLGPVDMLVTNAGMASFQDDTEMPLELWNRILAVNLNGTFHCVWRAKAGMRQRGYGNIVCVSSVGGLRPSQIRPDRLIAYGTSKAAVIGFARSCAAALGPEIRVNCVAPGLIDTDMTKDMTDETRARLIAATPLKRTGQPEDVAALTHFLLSDASSFVTGQTYVTSGGAVTSP
jgi:3-oxoacyl-[acyl-carrier protein] reductase